MFTVLAIPFRDQSMLLGFHLALATRGKILRGQYVDVFSLLFREQDKKDPDKWQKALYSGPDSCQLVFQLPDVCGGYREASAMEGLDYAPVFRHYL